MDGEGPPAPVCSGGGGPAKDGEGCAGREEAQRRRREGSGEVDPEEKQPGRAASPRAHPAWGCRGEGAQRPLSLRVRRCPLWLETEAKLGGDPSGVITEFLQMFSFSVPVFSCL